MAKSTAPAATLAPPVSLTFSRSGLTALVLYCLGHFFIDMYSSALGAFQPLLVTKFNITLAQAGVLGGLLVFSSSLMQPAYGYLSDRYHSKLFSALAPAVAGIFISALGLATNYGWLVVGVLLGGAGIASFHPQASARATAGVVHNRSRWMAVFISSGTLGLALGPTAFSYVLEHGGLERAYILAIPGIIVTVCLTFLLPSQNVESRRKQAFEWAPLKAVWKPLSILYTLVFIRSIVQITYTQFLPLYLTRERGFSFSESNHALTAYLAAGAIGGFVGGNLADRFGGRAVIIASMIGCVPCLALFFLGTGFWSIAGLAMGGWTLLFTIPVNVVMGQQLAPSQAGTVSALMMGFAWGLAGLIFIPLTGWAADHFSLGQALGALVLFPIAGFALALTLPKNLQH